jgi:hypothetical protein
VGAIRLLLVELRRDEIVRAERTPDPLAELDATTRGSVITDLSARRRRSA